MSKKYANLLSPIKLPNGVVLKNRLTSSASTNNLIQADSADWPREAMIMYFANRAKNGAGMITVTGLKEKGSFEFYRKLAGDPKFTLFDLTNPTTQTMFGQLSECVHMHGSKMIVQLLPISTMEYDVSDGGTFIDHFIDLSPHLKKNLPKTKDLTKVEISGTSVINNPPGGI